MSFNALFLSPEIIRAVSEQGYTDPTPIQKAAIPVVLAGRDLLAAAQTGTGKTAAFTLPLIQRLQPFANTSLSPARHTVRAVVLTPTRELADQIFDNVVAYSKYIPLKSVLLYGGVAMEPQAAALRAGAEIIVATPGRLLDHLQQKNLQFSQLEYLVLDEADRMLDMGFIQDIRKIMGSMPSQRQTLLFSATFSTEIKKLADQLLNQPQVVEIARDASTSEQIEQRLYEVPAIHKKDALLRLLAHYQIQQALIFTRTKLSAERLSRQLLNENVNAVAIHGNKTQLARLEALNALREGRARVLVATDVAARGIDITALPHVINYELPTSAEDYVHRIGRTGRAGAHGIAISLVSPEESKQLAAISAYMKQPLSLEPFFESFPSGSETALTPSRQRPTRRPNVPSEIDKIIEQVVTPLCSGARPLQIPALFLPPRFKKASSIPASDACDPS